MKRKINGMKNIPSFKILTLGCMLVALSCSRKATDFKDFLDDKELVFPGKVTNVTVLPGKQRLMLKWPPSPDPSITKYLVYWNNKMDSLVVNATSVGMGAGPDDDGPRPADPRHLGPGQVVVDAVYQPVLTPLLRAAADRGATAVDGVGMLVHQAARAFTTWTGEAAPVATMRQAADDALRGFRPKA